MALSTYSELQASVASWLHRSDLTTEIQDFIRLAEADLQVRAKLSQWDTSATVSLTSGVGSLPSDYAQTISVAYNQVLLTHLPPAQFDSYLEAAGAGTPVTFAVRGASLLVAPTMTGDVTLRYTARFTALSDSATTNSLLTLFPDAYLNGALAQACVWLHDKENAQLYGMLFDSAVNRVRKFMNEYKYPHGLQMRAA